MIFFAFFAALREALFGSGLSGLGFSMARKIYFITGGARSGKSAYAEKLAHGLAGKRAYIATAQALDAEMAAKIAKHRKDRGDAWDTYEEPLAVAELLQKLSSRYQVALLDCLTLWLSNVMAHTDGDGAVLSRVDGLVQAITGFHDVLQLIDQGHGTPCIDDGLQTLPFEILHDEVRGTIVVAQVVNNHDVRVL